MKRSTTVSSVLALILAAGWVGAARAQTPVDTGWTYQGKLTDNGAPAAGNYDLRFSLFQDDQATLPVGPVLDLPGTPVDAGLFSVRLDFGAQFAGLKNWLVVEVSPEGAGTYTALPPQEITSTPQALFSQLSPGLTLPYTGTADVPSPGAVFNLTNTNPDSGRTLWCQTDGTNGVGVVGTANATTGFAYGGLFQSFSTDGRGVRGEALAETGLAIGGRFASGSTSGIGTWSTAVAATGTTYGVYGDNYSTAGTGVFGGTHALSGTTYGVYGLSHSTAGIGAYGLADSPTGFNVGGEFVSNSTDGRGVRGIANASTGLAVGGRFASGSTSGIGVWSTASATSGANFGVYGETNSAAGYGGYFRNTAVGGAALWADGLAKVKTLQILGGSDLAEPFDVRGSLDIVPGMVVAIDERNPGDLRLADQPYDGKVAGVISGANGLAPGMVMRAEGQDHADGQHPVAMTGRVWCYVDASFGAIKPGDRLTTSATPGHAMKASDATRSDGAVIGKAMTELQDGTGLVLVLVNLQ